MGQRSTGPQVEPRPWRLWLLVLLPLALVLSGCSLTAINDSLFGPGATPTPTAAPLWPVTVGCDPALPDGVCRRLQALVAQDPAHFTWAPDPVRAAVRLSRTDAAGAVRVGAWTYAVAAPFRTVEDEVASADVQATWCGSPSGPFAVHPLRVTTDTLHALTVLWGPPASPAVRTVEKSALLAEAGRTGAWAIIPFDELEVGWKALRVDGISLLEKGLVGSAAARYPLQMPLILTSDRRPDALPLLARSPDVLSNRREGRMTVVAMTGTTVLARMTARTMERRGIVYPARDVVDWLLGADLTHISNEAGFMPNTPIPVDAYTMSFCSDDRYIALLEAVGTDIVELTGNHLVDYGREPLRHALELYRQRGWRWYGGGANLADATRPLTITHGANRLAFLGCNPVGPSYDWATGTSPGSAPADYARLKAQIRELRAAGYLPIVTLQYWETYQYTPTPQQVADFRALAAAGAVVVQGSQAHQPQAMELYGDTFIHYGLGNLFFDQMWSLGTRQEFVDRLVFYDGRLLSVDLRTALLEEYARPRPMTVAERAAFLKMIFSQRLP